MRGWDEFELEVIRDRRDNVVIVCSIENLDPMGVHTGDSVTVAPQMTLSDEAYQELRDAAIAVIRAVGVETGGSNIQFARDRETGDIRVIEMNPRVSRSSALASKATGYPIAKVAAKLAVGYTLDEIPNDLTKTTPASFEPTLDYVVVKMPRFAFEKFPGADTTLGTQMKSVGEAMGIGRTFQEAFAKAFASRELDAGAVTPWATLDDLPEDLHPWFRRELDQLREEGRRREPRAYRRVDSCAGEVSADSNYYYSTRGEADEPLPPPTKPRVVILGSGPNRIGQGIEFDYCCVHAAQSFRALGYEAIMVNCNPETVSTDYDTSDRLYFEPLDVESVLAVCEREQPEGVVIQFGGQTPLKLARAIEAAGFKVLGTPYEAVDLAEDRERFGLLLDELGVRCPEWGIADDPDAAVEIAERVGYPVLVRPSYVLGGRAMRVCYDEAQVRTAMAGVTGPALVDRFLEGALEIDVDALCDGVSVHVGAVMEHVEEAGIHSGDSSCVLPSPSLDDEAYEEVCRVVRRLGPALGVVGLLNVQLALVNGEVSVIEVNPRASRTVPFASKATGVNLVDAAVRLAAGARLHELELPVGAATGARERQGRGAPVFTLPRLRPGARPGDALDGRGDGERSRPAVRLRQGRACRREAAPDGRHGVPLGARRRQGRDRAGRRGARRSGLQAPCDRRHRRRARAPRCDDGGEGQRRRRRDPGRTLRSRRQHAAGVGRSARRRPDPADRACGPRPLHHDARRRPTRRRRDRERPRRDHALACRSGSSMRRERRRLTAVEQIGPYTLLRVERDGLDAGAPGQFFMLEAPGRVLPRPMSVCRATPRELAFLIDPIGPGTQALCELEPGDELHLLGPLGNGFDLDVERPLLVGGGIGIAPLPYLSQRLGGPPAILGFRTEWHAEAAALAPERRGLHRADLRDRAAARRAAGRARLRARADAGGAARPRTLRPARLGGADGVRLRSLLRLRGRDRRRAEAALRRRTGAPCCLTPPAASTRSRRRRSRARSTPS